MAAFVGVVNLFGLSAPASGVAQESSYEDSIGIEKERGSDGNTAKLVPQKFVRRLSRISGIGDAEIAAALADAGEKAKGAIGIIRAKQDEFQNAVCKFEIEGVTLLDAPGVGS